MSGATSGSTSSSLPPPNPNVGAWQPASGGGWTWLPGATPDPNLASKWGPGALTNPIEAPDGTLNHGAWIPADAANAPSVTGGANTGQSTSQPVENYGSGWIWVWGATPSASQLAKYGAGTLTNPNRDPGGGKGVNVTPPPPDVTPPVVADTWGGVAPDLTGAVDPLDQPPDQTQLKQPPDVQPFKVSPGSIRNQENALLSSNDSATSDYNSLRNDVAGFKTQVLSTDPDTQTAINDTMDNLVYSYANYITAVGQLIAGMNLSAQNYVNADKKSFFPPISGH